ncbi:helix-turn-helix domain-containing protein [Streptomonospora wellingtoniae]|uniref:Helix-turn-helix transcriptional regulator n=1 Tax=Streptomonospora wellingtoniae TaxID=3075544 RepID=A0ABU2L186_9ACTN|nr:helix-turn-helix transcriptional regulator [Streptomonospora sp. DSM 45055]MDT0305098.1 helix-turn-helix transcriptional regulator [Streptomonospora sp. DSM 45055]
MHGDTWAPEGFAAALAAVATAYGYTHDDMARRARIHRSQISRWASGRHRPSYEALDRLLAAAVAEDPTRTGLMAAAARTAGYQRLAAVYADRAPDPDPDPEPPAEPAGGRYTVETRPVEGPIGETVAYIVRDLQADTDDMTEEEGEEAIQAVLESMKYQARIAWEAERARIARERRRREREHDG